MRLLDDETPEVRQHVAARIDACGGDISEWMATWSGRLSSQEREVLCQMLGETRRRNLEREWIVPTGGAAAIREDWDTFEATLRLLSDFLHDGVTVRQSLSDALDLLAEEAESAGVITERQLSDYLFKGEHLNGNKRDPKNPCNADLAWAIANERSTALGLGIIFILLGRRMNMEIEGVNFPGHFLCRVYEQGIPLIIDCFSRGTLHMQMTLLEGPGLTRRDREIIQQPMSLDAILLMLMNDLIRDLDNCGRTDDARLIRTLQGSLCK